MQIEEGKEYVLKTNGAYQPFDLPTGSMLLDHLPKGFYKILVSKTMMGIAVKLLDDNPRIPASSISVAKSLVDFSYIDELLSETSKKVHTKLNINRKVGYLFHGKQGSGKTSTMYAMAQVMIDNHDACVFTVHDDDEFLEVIKIIENLRKLKDFPAVIILDECEYYLNKYEAYFKSVLDGSKSLDNIIYIMSTNYIDSIPETIKDRPSRFKFVYQIDGIDDESSIYEILRYMNESLEDMKVDDTSLRTYVNEMKGYTIDQIKNKFVDIAFMENNLVSMLNV